MNDRDCEKCKHHTEKGCDSWDCKFEPCDIAISKQAVLNILDDMIKNYAKSNDFVKANGVAWVKVQKLPSVNPQKPKTGHWILSSEKMPENPSIVACDAYNNKPWIPRGILITETENGKKKLYDAATYNGNLKAFLKGKELTSFSGNTFYLPPREIISWMPLPKPYNPQEESEDKE